MELITIDDVRKHRQLAKNFDTVKFSTYVNDVQTYFLRDLIGKALYLKLITGLSETTPEPKWTELLNGKIYTNNGEIIEYLGLKPFLCYHFLAVFGREADTNLTEAGSVSMSGANYRPSNDRGEIEEIHKVRATYYGNEILEFLSVFRSVYSGNVQSKSNNTDLIFSII